MTKQSPHTRWKGCAMCKPHKFKSQGDTGRTPYVVLRKFGVKRRFSRNKIYLDE